MEKLRDYVNFIGSQERFRREKVRERLPEKISQNPEFQALLNRKKKHFDSIERISDPKNRKMCIKAVISDHRKLKFCDPSFLNDPDFILHVYQQYIAIERPFTTSKFASFKICPPSIRNNKKVCLYVVSVDENAFKYCSNEMRDDIDVSMEAINCDYNNLRYCSTRLRNTPQIYEFAIQRNGEAIKYTPNEIRNDIQWVLKAIRRSSWAFRCCSKKIKDNDEVARVAIESNGLNYNFCSERIKQDNFFIELAMEKNCSLKFLPAKIRTDKNKCMFMIKKCIYNVEYVGENVFNDKVFILFVLNTFSKLKYSHSNDMYASLDLKKHLDYIPTTILDDEEVMNKIFKCIEKDIKFEKSIQLEIDFIDSDDDRDDDDSCNSN